MNMTVEKYIDVDVDVTLKCAECGADLKSERLNDE